MWKVRGNVEICVIRRVAMEDMERDAFLYRNRGA
jgi:hypothetical protein